MSGADYQREPKHQDDDHQRGNPERDECRTGSADEEGLSSQTGQDRTRSTEAGSEVGEPEQTESQQLGLTLPSALSTLTHQEALQRWLESPQRDTDAAELDQPDQDQKRTDGDAQNPTGCAGERDVFDDGVASQGDRCPEQRQERDHTQRQRGRECERVPGWLASLTGLGSLRHGAAQHPP